MKLKTPEEIAKENKNLTVFSFRIRGDVLDEFEAFAEENNMRTGTLINGVLEDYLEQMHREGKYPRKKSDASIECDEIFRLKGIDAKMEIRNGKFVVLGGSEINPNITSKKEEIKKMRSKYKSYLQGYRVKKNISFETPSAAAMFVRGGSSNGYDYWRTEDGKTLGEVLGRIRNERG